MAFKQPTFQERAALAAKAKQAALQKLREKPPLDEAVVAERVAAQQARLEAQARVREEKLAARELEKAERKARAEAEAIVPEPEPEPEPELSDAEKKALRDARYAARKARVGKKK